MTPEELEQEFEAIIRARRSELERFERMLSILKEKGSARSNAPEVSPDQFKLFGVGSAAREFVRQNGSVHLDEIREALLRGSCDMGKYPKRSIKVAIVNSPKIFVWEDDKKNPLVSLRKAG